MASDVSSKSSIIRDDVISKEKTCKCYKWIILLIVVLLAFISLLVYHIPLSGVEGNVVGKYFGSAEDIATFPGDTQESSTEEVMNNNTLDNSTQPNLTQERSTQEDTIIDDNKNSSKDTLDNHAQGNTTEVGMTDQTQESSSEKEIPIEDTTMAPLTDEEKLNLHLKIVDAFKCHDPQPRSVEIADLMADISLASSERIVPTSTVLHRCDSDTGCCKIPNFHCALLQQEDIDLVILVVNIDRNVKSRQEVVPAKNHTLCSCQLNDSFIK